MIDSAAESANAAAMAGGHRKLIAAVVAAALVLLLLVSLVTARRTPVYPPLPEPNGYEELVKAGRLISGPVGDYGKLPEAELHDLITTNAEALRVCRLGLSQTCSVPTEATVTNFAAVLPSLAELKRLAQLLAAEGRLAELEGHPGDAARSYADAMQLGNAISHGGFIIHRLVGIAAEAIGGTRLAQLLPKLQTEDCRRVAQLLGDVDARGVSWEEVARGEKLFARHELRKLPNLVAGVVARWSNRSTIARAKQRHNSVVAHRRLLMAELGLRAYQSETRRAASSLQELVPKHLPHVPVDPFSGQPLKYIPQGTNWLLYSVGPDGVDNGRSRGGLGPNKGDLFYSSSW